MIELTVTVKGEESSYKQKFLCYELVTMSLDDPIIKDCVAQALANSKIEPEDIKIRVLMVVE